MGGGRQEGGIGGKKGAGDALLRKFLRWHMNSDLAGVRGHIADLGVEGFSV